MAITHTRQGYIGHFSKDEIPSDAAELIRGYPIDEDDGIITIYFPDNQSANEFQSLVLKQADKDRPKDVSEARKYNMYLETVGICDPSDIELIFEIQQGTCYFTGQPISNIPKSFTIDHLTPISSGGSCWPSNVALVTKEVNTKKSWMTKAQYWKKLETLHGTSWAESRKEVCKTIDRERRKIDIKRRNAVKTASADLQATLIQKRPDAEIEYVFQDGHPVLNAHSIEIHFPPGLLRKKRQFCSIDYYLRVIDALEG